MLRYFWFLCAILFAAVQPAQTAPDSLSSREVSLIAKEAFNRYGIFSAYPEIRVSSGVRGVRDCPNCIARAVLYEGGKERLMLSQSAFRTDPESLAEYIEHEASHFAAWREYGSHIPEHGAKWLRVCREHASKNRVCRKER